MNKLVKTLNQTLSPWVVKRINRVLEPIGAGLPDKQRHSSLLDSNYKAAVTSITHETSRAITLELELLEGYRLNYKAGQYVTVSLPIGATIFQRCYSFSSAPHENRYALTIQKVFNGRVSAFLKHKVSVGDVLYIDDPAGDFVLPLIHPEKQHYVMVAAGAGIVPVYSLIKDLLGKNPKADIQLIYATRKREQAIFLRSLERMSKEYTGFSLHTQYTRRNGEEHDPYRRLDGDKILSRLSDPSSARFYICGPSGLARKCLQGLREAGIAESKIKVEIFNAPPKSHIHLDLKPRAITFLPGTMMGKNQHIRQRQVETLLETAQKAGLNLPQQCTTGNCQKCRLKVKSGTVIMDEPNTLSLEDARNGYVLGCVAYPCEQLVVKPVLR